jgi:opacity protein-like surface antigen
MKRTLYLVVLLVALTGSAYAGDMPQPGASISEAAAQGDMGQPLAEIIATVLETALSLI